MGQYRFKKLEKQDLPETLEGMLKHFEDMYNDYNDVLGLAKFALDNVIEIRSEKIIKDHCV